MPLADRMKSTGLGDCLDVGGEGEGKCKDDPKFLSPVGDRAIHWQMEHEKRNK